MNPNDWDATKRAVADLCRELWADIGHGHVESNAELITKITDVRAAIHRSAEVTRQPWGAVVTVHGDLDRAASAWSERGSEAHRQAQADASRARTEAAKQYMAKLDAATLAERVAKGLPADWKTIEVKPGVRTVLEAPWGEFCGSALDAPGVMVWFDDNKEPAGLGAEAGDVVREVLDLRHAIANTTG